MGENTAISWAHDTFNLWIGCWKIDPECKHCYAETTDNQRWGGEHWGRTAPRKWTGDTYWKQLAKWNRKARETGERRRVFVGSLMDWAERHPVPEIRAEMDARLARFWGIAKECESLDFLMLTKRPEDAGALLPWASGGAPWSNIWIGVTAGTRDTLARKVTVLRSIPATMRFISCEPMLEDIPREDWNRALAGVPGTVYNYLGDTADGPGPIDWLIVGNESGHKRRPAEQDWVRTARDAAEHYGVQFHFKQWVEPNGKKIHLPILDGVQHAGFPEAAR
jgi:protein gp37